MHLHAKHTCDTYSREFSSKYELVDHVRTVHRSDTCHMLHVPHVSLSVAKVQFKRCLDLFKYDLYLNDLEQTIHV